MATVRYTTVGGEVLAEKRGGVRRQYVPDPLGSTVALLDNSQSKTDTFAYWPYGEEAARTGTTNTPLRFVGTLGYYRDNATRAYVRARHLDTRAGRWTSEDPLRLYWRNAFLYADNEPATLADPSGLQASPVRPGGRPSGGRHPKEDWKAWYRKPKIPLSAWKCWPLGPFNAYPCAKYAASLAENVSTQGYQGDADGTPQNALKHCLLGCYVASMCGRDAYEVVVVGHELPSNEGGNGGWDPEGNSGMDLFNDEQGLQCASEAGLFGAWVKATCASCCARKLHQNQLGWIDEPPRRPPRPRRPR